MRILLVEDDELLGGSVRRALSAEGYAVDWLVEGESVLPALRTHCHDLLLLDIRLPGRSGIEVLKELRSQGMRTPVLLLTAFDAVSDKVTGLDAGADDYLTKPFEMDELSARVRSLLRRGGNKMPTLKGGGLEIDPGSRHVAYEGKEVADLTLKEYSILELLLRNRGKFVAKEQLLETNRTWEDDAVGSNTVEVYISRLRKRFSHELIETLRGFGYRIK